MKSFIHAFAFIALTIPSRTDAAPPGIEAGTVTWGRDLDAALTSSKQSAKPVFAFFQEIPGCAGCQQFGKDVLSHPLVVEAIETEFTPLLIHNNKPGKDAAALQRFKDPAWNYQVVRFLDSDAKDAGCQFVQNTSKFTVAPGSDQKKQLSGTLLEKISLSPSQSAKINAWIRVDTNKAMRYLTPSQRAEMK